MNFKGVDGRAWRGPNSGILLFLRTCGSAGISQVRPFPPPHPSSCCERSLSCVGGHPTPKLVRMFKYSGKTWTATALRRTIEERAKSGCLSNIPCQQEYDPSLTFNQLWELACVTSLKYKSHCNLATETRIEYLMNWQVTLPETRDWRGAIKHFKVVLL